MAVPSTASPQIPANTAVGTSASIQLLPGGAGALAKSTNNYLSVETGTVTANGATPVTVANAAVTANSIIVFTLKTVGGTVSPNALNVLTITPGTGFTVGGTASDTSVYNYMILG